VAALFLDERVSLLTWLRDRFTPSELLRAGWLPALLAVATTAPLRERRVALEALDTLDAIPAQMLEGCAGQILASTVGVSALVAVPVLAVVLRKFSQKALARAGFFARVVDVLFAASDGRAHARALLSTLGKFDRTLLLHHDVPLMLLDNLLNDAAGAQLVYNTRHHDGSRVPLARSADRRDVSPPLAQRRPRRPSSSSSSSIDWFVLARQRARAMRFRSTNQASSAPGTAAATAAAAAASAAAAAKRAQLQQLQQQLQHARSVPTPSSQSQHIYVSMAHLVQSTTETARRARDASGYTTMDGVDPHTHFQSQACFHPYATRAAAEEILNSAPLSSFLVRPSNETACYALSFGPRRRGQRPQHCLARLDAVTGDIVVNARRFRSVEHLAREYGVTPLPCPDYSLEARFRMLAAMRTEMAAHAYARAHAHSAGSPYAGVGGVLAASADGGAATSSGDATRLRPQYATAVPLPSVGVEGSSHFGNIAASSIEHVPWHGSAPVAAAAPVPGAPMPLQIERDDVEHFLMLRDDEGSFSMAKAPGEARATDTWREQPAAGSSARPQQPRHTRRLSAPAELDRDSDGHALPLPVAELRRRDDGGSSAVVDDDNDAATGAAAAAAVVADDDDDEGGDDDGADNGGGVAAGASKRAAASPGGLWMRARDQRGARARLTANNQSGTLRAPVQRGFYYTQFCTADETAGGVRLQQCYACRTCVSAAALNPQWRDPGLCCAVCADQCHAGHSLHYVGVLVAACQCSGRGLLAPTEALDDGAGAGVARCRSSVREPVAALQQGAMNQADVDIAVSVLAFVGTFPMAYLTDARVLDALLDALLDAARHADTHHVSPDDESVVADSGASAAAIESDERYVRPRRWLSARACDAALALLARFDGETFHRRGAPLRLLELLAVPTPLRELSVQAILPLLQLHNPRQIELASVLTGFVARLPLLLWREDFGELAGAMLRWFGVSSLKHAGVERALLTQIALHGETANLPSALPVDDEADNAAPPTQQRRLRRRRRRCERRRGANDDPASLVLLCRALGAALALFGLDSLMEAGLMHALRRAFALVEWSGSEPASGCARFILQLLSGELDMDPRVLCGGVQAMMRAFADCGDEELTALPTVLPDYWALFESAHMLDDTLRVLNTSLDGAAVAVLAQCPPERVPDLLLRRRLLFELLRSRLKGTDDGKSVSLRRSFLERFEERYLPLILTFVQHWVEQLPLAGAWRPVFGYLQYLASGRLSCVSTRAIVVSSSPGAPRRADAPPPDAAPADAARRRRRRHAASGAVRVARRRGVSAGVVRAAVGGGGARVRPAVLLDARRRVRVWRADRRALGHAHCGVLRRQLGAGDRDCARVPRRLHRRRGALDSQRRADWRWRRWRRRRRVAARVARGRRARVGVGSERIGAATRMAMRYDDTLALNSTWERAAGGVSSSPASVLAAHRRSRRLGLALGVGKRGFHGAPARRPSSCGGGCGGGGAAAVGRRRRVHAN
jgi:hypothetical protein